MLMRSLLRAGAFACAAAFGAPATADSGFFARLLGERVAPVDDGSYIAGDRIKFALTRAGNNYLLRFDGDAETYVLHADHTSMGGRMLKYDSGETALLVAGWGGLTLYTDAQPNGLPAVRSGDAQPFTASAVSLKDVQFIAAQEAERLAKTRHLRIAFIVDWSVLETDAALRANASDAMENAARGIQRFVQNRQSRRLLADRVSTVALATGTHAALGLHDRTLIVTFNPEQGYAGCASSRAVARALTGVLQTTRAASRRP